MHGWKSVLRNDSTEWLLEEGNPSVQYFVLTELEEKPESDPEVNAAKTAIMNHGVVPKILGYMSLMFNDLSKLDFFRFYWDKII